MKASSISSRLAETTEPAISITSWNWPTPHRLNQPLPPTPPPPPHSITQPLPQSTDPLIHQSSSPPTLDPDSYVPRTLAGDLTRRGKIPCGECVQITLCLRATLQKIHDAGLVHRDIKPSNIIFVDGAPKLADIGLVARTEDARSYVGTEGFMPPEGPGSAKADIFSLGKVLYELATGRDRLRFPELKMSAWAE